MNEEFGSSQKVTSIQQNRGWFRVVETEFSGVIAAFKEFGGPKTLLRSALCGITELLRSPFSASRLGAHSAHSPYMLQQAMPDSTPGERDSLVHQDDIEGERNRSGGERDWCKGPCDPRFSGTRVLEMILPLFTSSSIIGMDKGVID